MASVFISYRRHDTEGEAGRLFDGLAARVGAEHVFIDVTGIDAGLDFREAIATKLSSCDVLLAVIGRSWLEPEGERRRRRIDDPTDPLRVEIVTALERKLPVIPVLVHGAVMPQEDDLPAPLKPLAYRNALELRHTHWDVDVAVLVDAVARRMGERTAQVPRPEDPQAPGRGDAAREVPDPAEHLRSSAAGRRRPTRSPPPAPRSTRTAPG
jgi:hypothetical protein